MAFPTILVNSTGGSDTAASGAGPTTALSGTTNASFSGSVITLPGGTDLSGVAVDGSHVIYLLTSTGVRFFKITAKAGLTVTVTPAPAGTTTARTWAIGGKRASIGSASSILLVDQSSAAGDAMPGWIIEFQSGHTETITTGLRVYRAGDTTSGPIILRGTTGAATLPKLNFSGDTSGIILTDMHQVRDLEIGSNGAKSGGTVAVNFAAGFGMCIERVKITDGTGGNRWGNGIGNGFGSAIIRCEVANCVNDGIDLTTSGLNGAAGTVAGNYIHDCSGHGLNIFSGVFFSVHVVNNIFESNTGDGMFYDASRDDGLVSSSTIIYGNTFYNNGSDGIDLSGAIAAYRAMLVANNIFANNAVYGLNTDFTDIHANAYNMILRNNCFFGNGTNKYNPTTLGTIGVSTDESTADPQFVDAPNGNFTIGTNLRAIGFPSIVGVS